jgi:diaminopimelate decarboxylase
MKSELHSAIARFPVVDGELSVGGVSLSMLAARVGQTPFYAYDRGLIAQRVAELRRALPPPIELHYAIKANPMPALVCHIAPLVGGLDVASGAELSVALDSAMQAEHISFAGPGKSANELAQALAAGVLINLESMREIALLAEIGSRLGRRARVAVRVNPDFELKASGMKMGGGPKQFGIDAEVVPAALAEIGRVGLAFEGFHIFSGSQNLRAEAICESQTKALDMAVRLARDAPEPIKVLNLGGGFGIPYFAGEKPLDLTAVGAHLHSIVAAAKQSLPSAKLVIELGRYLVGEAGLYVCKVIDRKVSRGEVFLVTDGGLHHHLSASGNFGQVLRKNYPVAIGNRMLAAQDQIASVVGPLCTPLDLLADKMDLGHAQPGDFVVVFQSGAYGLTASPGRFLSHPLALEFLV